MTDINQYNEHFDYSNDQVSAVQLKAQARQQIEQVAGDSASIQGTIADTAQITMLAMGQLLLQLKAGKSIDEIIASDPAFASCVKFAQAEAAGSMKMPFKQKPDGEAMADIIKRTDAVAGLYRAS
jgi:hypothetical protein